MVILLKPIKTNSWLETIKTDLCCRLIWYSVNNGSMYAFYNWVLITLITSACYQMQMTEPLICLFRWYASRPPTSATHEEWVKEEEEGSQTAKSVFQFILSWKCLLNTGQVRVKWGYNLYNFSVLLSTSLLLISPLWYKRQRDKSSLSLLSAMYKEQAMTQPLLRGNILATLPPEEYHQLWIPVDSLPKTAISLTSLSIMCKVGNERVALTSEALLSQIIYLLTWNRLNYKYTRTHTQLTTR